MALGRVQAYLCLYTPRPGNGKRRFFRSSGQTTNRMVVDLAGTRKRPETLTMWQEQRTHEREEGLEPQRPHSSGASSPAPAQRWAPDELALGSRHDWPASPIVRNDQPCDGSTRARHQLGRNRAKNTPSQVSLPIPGQHPGQRQFVCGSLSQVYILVHCPTTNKLPNDVGCSFMQQQPFECHQLLQFLVSSFAKSFFTVSESGAVGAYFRYSLS